MVSSPLNLLNKARGMNHQDLINEVKKSNLRGRGGAGFNCGMKWDFAYRAEADQKYVICNADEGEPGTYKDRLIMENDPPYPPRRYGNMRLRYRSYPRLYLL